jgi:hypothetical protein
MTRPTLASPPGQLYEELRAAILCGRPGGQRGLATLIHQGLAAWIRELGSIDRAAPSTAALAPSAPLPPRSPSPAPSELTRLLAGLIVAITAGGDPTHA